jgi:hypothetical protein
LGVDCYKQNEILDYQPHPAKLGNLWSPQLKSCAVQINHKLCRSTAITMNPIVSLFPHPINTCIPRKPQNNRWRTFLYVALPMQTQTSNHPHSY